MIDDASQLRKAGKADAGLSAAKSALIACYRRWGEKPDAHPSLMWVWLELGLNQSSLGQFSEADSSFKYSLAIARQALGESHPQTAQIQHTLGVNQLREGKLEEAFQCFQSSLATLISHAAKTPQVAPGEINREEVDPVLHNLIAVLFQQGKFADCDSQFRDYHSVFAATFSETLDTARFQNNWALVMQQLGDLPAADSLLRESLRIRRKLLGERHPALVGSLANLGQIAIARKAPYEEVEPFFQEAIAIASETMPPSHPSALEVHRSFTRAKASYGRYQDATSYLKSVLEQATASPPSSDDLFGRLSCQKLLAELHLQSGEMKESEDLLKSVVGSALAVPSVGSTPLAPLLLEALECLANLYTQTAEVGKAVEIRNLMKQIRSPVS